MINDRKLLHAALRNDLSAFTARVFQTVSPSQRYQHGWHIDAITWHLEECAAGRIKRLIITLPPRSLKSVTVTVAFSAWLLGRDPTARIIAASYSNELSAKHGRDVRTVMESPWFKRLFPGTRIDPSKNTEFELVTTRRGGRLATSVGGTLTGRGGNFVILDDTLKPADAISEAKREALKSWFDGTLYSRLDSKKDDVIIIVQQRVHIDDLVGHVLGKKAEGWVHLDLPAIAEEEQVIPIGPREVHRRAKGEVLHPEREPLEVLKKMRELMGTYFFSAQYQQRPIPTEGNLIQWRWFAFYEPPLERRAGDVVIQSWDTAMKPEQLNDYSVCTTWLARDGKHYLLDVLRERLDFPALKRAVIAQAARYNPDTILIEDKGSGTSLIQDLRHDGNLPVRGFAPEGDKVLRMSAQSAQIEQGNVLLPKEDPGLDEFRREVLQFPDGRYDDQVDSMSQYLTWMKDHSAVEGEVIVNYNPILLAMAEGRDPDTSPECIAYLKQRMEGYGGNL